jgi:hypothetical protein
MTPPLVPAFTPAPTPPAAPRRRLFQRLTTGLPLLVTIGLHVVLGLVAAAIVVQRTGAEKKRVFEAVPSATATAVKQVEHRLQIARRGGASGAAASPVSANRIFSSSPSALALPELPDLPSLSTGGFGGFGSAGSGVGLGAGVGLATSLGGGTGLGGRGFMSLSFLGATTPNPSQMVFVVDTGTGIMAPAKGGFRAFAIIREEIMRLVGRLPPTCRFNVILYRAGSGRDDSGTDEAGVELNLFQPGLVVASTENKKDFFAWMTPVNAKLGAFGPGSATRDTAWKRKPLPPDAGIDPLLYPPVWSRAVHAALEQQPTTVFVITSTDGVVRRTVDETTTARRNTEVERSLAAFNAELLKAGLTLEAVTAARDRAYRKAGRELAAANKKLVAAGKDPVVVTSNPQIFTAAVQAELQRHGISITLDLAGWSRPDGTPYKIPERSVGGLEGATWNDFHAHLAKLQKALLTERAVLNMFLFVGPNDKALGATENLTAVAKRNGGTFRLLTADRLESLQTRDETPAP